MNSIKNSTIIIITAVSILLTLLAIVFYKERMIFIDTSFYLFELCRTGKVFVGHFRFGGILPQILPYIAMKLNAPLYVLTLLYSISFHLFFVLVIYFLWFKVKDEKAALVVFLAQVMLNKFNYFWPASELSMAIGLTVLLYAMINKQIDEKNWKNYFIFLLPIFSFALVFFHPLVVVSIGFLFIYGMIKYPSNRKYNFAALLMLMTLYFFRTMFIKTPYDENAKSGLDQFYTHLPNYFHLTSTKNCIQYFLHDYYITSLIIVGTLAYLFFKRRILTAIFFGASVFGILLLININYPAGGPQFYLENQYNLVAYMTAVVLVHEVLAELTPIPKASIILTISIFCIVRLITTASYFTNRLDYYRDILKKTETLEKKKLVLAPNQYNQDSLIMSWCSSYEIWHLSTIEQKESRSIVLEEKEKEFEWIIGVKNKFFQKFGSQDYKELNPRYFIMNDTSGYVRK